MTQPEPEQCTLGVELDGGCMLLHLGTPWYLLAGMGRGLRMAAWDLVQRLKAQGSLADLYRLAAMHVSRLSCERIQDGVQ